MLRSGETIATSEVRQEGRVAKFWAGLALMPARREKMGLPRRRHVTGVGFEILRHSGPDPP
jgi:hypothetical protein